MSERGGVIAAPPERLRAEIVVIGSGPGGALAGCLLAEAGRDVLVLEEGRFVRPETCPPFSREEMVEKYRNGSAGVALGRPSVAYVEACCVGGGSEVNSGLYHRAPSAVLAEWRERFLVDGLREADLAAYYEATERELGIGHPTDPPEAPARRLRKGAERLGWASREIPRFLRYESSPDGGGRGMTRQSMTRTYIPRMLAAGGRLCPRTRAARLSRTGTGWSIVAVHRAIPGKRRALTIRAGRVFLACGAIHTPALLRRSGVGRHAGDSLRAHPTIKVVALFPDRVNDAELGVPAQQVHEFSPRFSFGCSISSPAQMAVALADRPELMPLVGEEWPRMAVYYAMTRAGRGTVRNLPGLAEPLVRFRLRQEELEELGEAMTRLCECVLVGGAVTVFPTVPKTPLVSSLTDLEKLPRSVPSSTSALMTVHLFSSCRMGERRGHCTVDSFGKVHGVDGLYVSDASLLCGPPGVNPQGTIMAIVRRNVAAFLDRA